MSDPLTRAADLNLPRIRVPRLPNAGLFGKRRTYEVEFTEVGADEPSWTRTTHTPLPLIEPHLGLDEGPTVIKAADDSWRGGVGPSRRHHVQIRAPRLEHPHGSTIHHSFSAGHW